MSRNDELKRPAATSGKIGPMPDPKRELNHGEELTPFQISLAVQRIFDKLDGIEETLVRVETQVKATNGRVTKLEEWRMRTEAVKQALSWRGALALTVAGGVAVGVVMAVVQILIAG